MIKTVNDIKAMLIKHDCSMKMALQKLNSVSAPLLLVVDDQGRLLGTITDGDVRRAILRGLTINTPIESVMRTDPVVAAPEAGVEELRRLMVARGVRQVPLINKRGRLTGMFESGDGLIEAGSPLDNVAIIMCGGLGSRMGIMTNNCPKPMLKVGGKPILEHILSNLIRSGFSKFFLAIHYLGEKIEEYFQDGAAMGVEINYLREQKPLGTGGALSLWTDRPDRPDRPFLIMNGDILTDFNARRFLHFHESSGALATMGVTQYRHKIPYGVVRHEGSRLISLDEKPMTCYSINAGIYALSADFLSLVPQDIYISMPELLVSAQQMGHEVCVCPICEHWVDIGHEDAYRQVLGRNGANHHELEYV